MCSCLKNNSISYSIVFTKFAPERKDGKKYFVIIFIRKVRNIGYIILLSISSGYINGMNFHGVIVCVSCIEVDHVCSNCHYHMISHLLIFGLISTWKSQYPRITFYSNIFYAIHCVFDGQRCISHCMHEELGDLTHQAGTSSYLSQTSQKSRHCMDEKQS